MIWKHFWAWLCLTNSFQLLKVEYLLSWFWSFWSNIFGQESTYLHDLYNNIIHSTIVQYKILLNTNLLNITYMFSVANFTWNSFALFCPRGRSWNVPGWLFSHRLMNKRSVHVLLSTYTKESLLILPESSLGRRFCCREIL